VKNELVRANQWYALDRLRLARADSRPQHLPEGVGISALIILNLPNPFATGNDFPGGTFGISVNGTISPVVAVFTYNEQVPPSTGRIPTTLVVNVPLINKRQEIVGMWSGVRGSKVIIDTPATLSGLSARARMRFG
jgi:mannose-binding lectin